MQKLLVFYDICKEASAPATLEKPKLSARLKHPHCEGAVSRREPTLGKVGVEGSSPFARSRFSWYLNYFRQAAARRPCRFVSWGSVRGSGVRDAMP